METDIKQFKEENMIDSFTERQREFVQSQANGILKEMVTHHFKSEGKLLRPKLAFALAKAMKLEDSKVDGWAMSCDVLHNATLVHDDYQDGDKVRRGRPTVWAEYSGNMAINAGDYLLLLAPQAINQSDLDAETKIKLHDLFSKMSTAIVEGQCREFELNKLDNEHTLKSDYIECIRRKTAALFACLAKGVGIIAGKDQETQDHLFSIFDQLGIIFQIQDDLLDLYGEKQRGEAGCDIKEGKVSYLVVKHLALNPEDMEAVKNLLHLPREKTTNEHVEWFKNELKEKGTYQACINEFAQMVNALLENPLLRENAFIKDVVLNLLQKVLAPIEHIVSEKVEVKYESAVI
jgi:geranylgeranyl diphosphate synthase type I